MSRYTDWTSGEPIEKEWPMTGPTDPALRALDAALHESRDQWEHARAGEAYRTLERAVRAALAAAEAAPLDVTDTECVDAYDQGRADALREAAPLDVERLARAMKANPAYVTLDGGRTKQGRPTYHYDYVEIARRVAAEYAALRAPDTETAGEAGDGL